MSAWEILVFCYHLPFTVYLVSDRQNKILWDHQIFSVLPRTSFMRDIVMFTEPGCDWYNEYPKSSRISSMSSVVKPSRASGAEPCDGELGFPQQPTNSVSPNHGGLGSWGSSSTDHPWGIHSRSSRLCWICTARTGIWPSRLALKWIESSKKKHLKHDKNGYGFKLTNQRKQTMDSKPPTLTNKIQKMKVRIPASNGPMAYS
jgi:hypothetical protein